MVGSSRVGALCDFDTGSFISYFLNPTGSNQILSNPGGILWVSSKGLNRVTRFDPTTGAKIDDIISGGLLNNGPNAMRIEGNWLYIAVGDANNVFRYNLTNLATINSSSEVFVPNTAGLFRVEHIVFLDINDLPVPQAGADATVVAGQPFTLDGSASSDPENVPLAFKVIDGHEFSVVTQSEWRNPANLIHKSEAIILQLRITNRTENAILFPTFDSFSISLKTSDEKSVRLDEFKNKPGETKSWASPACCA